MATLYQDAIKDNLLYTVESIVNPDNNIHRDFLKIIQVLPNKRAPNTYVSPHKPYNGSSTQSPFRSQNFEIKIPQDTDLLHLIIE